MRFGVLDINPATNPAVLDTATWDPAAARRLVSEQDSQYWLRLYEAAQTGQPLPAGTGLTPHSASCSHQRGSVMLVAGLRDGQQVFVETRTDGEPLLGQPLTTLHPAPGTRISLHPADASVVDRFVRLAQRSPRALGPVARLGIGTRMTAALWPGIFSAMEGQGFRANAIQNSVREVNLLSSLLAGQPADQNVAFSFGTIESGYTGSSFEGLWVSGALEGLKHPAHLQFGADADHIQVKRGAGGLERARRVIAAARHYTFFTLDVSDILDYRALSADEGQAAELLEARLPSAAERRDVLAYHSEGGAHQSGLGEASIGRFVGKYWWALDAVQQLAADVAGAKGDQPFDLELSIDEHPPEIETVDCLTSEDELLFLLREAQRRGLPITHIAPNFGVEKGTDYRCPDGLPGLERRMEGLCALAQQYGVLLDVHSGDDLSSPTRHAIRRATGGRLHFKVSPMLQLLFAQVLQDYEPTLFGHWWDDAWSYARHEAELGSPLALACIREYEVAAEQIPSVHHSVFHHYGFRYVGQRNPEGQFPQREAFYSLSDTFYRAVAERVEQYLSMLADELL